MNQNKFIEELEKLNIKITNKKLNQLEKYYELLSEWNNKINLTNITDKEQVYLKHFYDSVTISKVIDLNSIENLCDIGTGAGFPGLVLKIIYPDLNVTLVDSLNKRIVFLNEVIKKLDLKNIEVYHARAEEFSKNNIEKYDVVTARAVAHLSILLEYSMPMIKINKYFIAMKANAEEEILESSNALKLLNSKIQKIENFKLPIELSNRTIIKIEKLAKTNSKYPRKNNEIKKKML